MQQVFTDVDYFASRARLRAPSRGVPLTDEQRLAVIRELVEFEYRTGGSMFEYERQAKARLGR